VLELDEAALNPDPIEQFRRWYQAALDASVPLPSAMALATTSASGEPSVRMVLLASVDEAGFVFQTHLDSPKARDLRARPRAALAFWWPALQRQVRVSGPVSPLSDSEASAYFEAEPPAIQAMIRACPQGAVIPDRSALEALYAAELAGGGRGRPSHWGGYRVGVDWIEFWQGRPNRLQDRLRYTRTPADDWRIERLVP
jgi:pyridoxamine 5'-phosphate oxidase